MKYFSFSRFFGEMWSGKNRRRNKNRKVLSQTRRRVGLNLEQLEDRLAPSIVTPVLPAPTVTNPTTLAGTSQFQFDAQVAIDPIDPLKIVEVHVAGPNGGIFSVAGDYSTDGGQTWNQFNTPNNLADPATFDTQPFAFDESVSITFDRSGQFYVVSDQQNNAGTSGAIVLNKFSFTGGAPTPVTLPAAGYPQGAGVLYRWFNDDPGFDPVVAVDVNLPTYTDPATGATQTDTMAVDSFVPLTTIKETGGITATATTVTVASNTGVPATPFVAAIGNEEVLVTNATTTTWTIQRGIGGTTAAAALTGAQIEQETSNPKAIYVAWSQLLFQPGGGNVNRIVVEASSDGGNDFTTLEPASNPLDTAADNATNPQILFTQGTTAGTVPGGQMNVFWSDGTSIVMASSQPDGGTVTGVAAVAQNFTFTGGNISPALSSNLTTVLYTAFTPGNPTMTVEAPPDFPMTDTFPAVPFIVSMGGFDLEVTAVNPGPAGSGTDVWTIPVADQGIDATTPTAEPAGTAINLLYIPPFPPFNALPTSIPVTTTFTGTVNINASNLSTINNLQLVLNMYDTNNQQFSVVLTPPAASGLAPITLVANAVDDNGKPTGLGLPAGDGIGIISQIVNGNLITQDDGTVFDQNANRDIIDPTASAPYVGNFEPEEATPPMGDIVGPGLAEVDGLTAAQLDGTWTLSVTAFVFNGTTTNGVTTTPPQFVDNWSLHFSGAISTTGLGTENTVSDAFGPLSLANGGTGTLPTSITDLYPTGTNGAGPGLTAAVDNTLGSYSPYQGRMYLAFAAPNGGTTSTTVSAFATNPTTGVVTLTVASSAGFPLTPFLMEVGTTGPYFEVTNVTGTTWTIVQGIGNTGAEFVGNGTIAPPLTVDLINQSNIDLTYSDDDGVTWSIPEQVNPDTAADNFSEGNRPNFMPTLAVDPTTGTVAIMWYDSSNDAAGDGTTGSSREANSISVSIDGGVDWSPLSYINTQVSMTNFLTGAQYTTGPIPGNEINGFFGLSQGLAAYGGHIYPVFSTNSNTTGSVIDTATVTTAAGPRVIYGDMGPVSTDSTAPTDTTASGIFTYNNTFASDGTRQLGGFVVQFDRPVDAASFTTSDVTVEYQNPNTGDITFIPVGQIVPLDENTGFGPNGIGVGVLADTFYVELQTPQSAVGTYSYAIGPTVQDDDREGNILTGSLTPTSTTMTVAASLGLPDTQTPVPFIIQVDNEEIEVTATNGTTWTIVRGFNGTVAAAHSAEASVTVQTGNLMDQNANTITGETSSTSGTGTPDQFAIPTPINGVPFAAPYDDSTLPLIIPGPHLVDTSVPNSVNGNYAPLITTPLTSAMSIAATTMAVESFGGFPTPTATMPFIVQVGDEDIEVTGIDAAAPLTWDVTRGFDGTTAAGHDVGTTVDYDPENLVLNGTENAIDVTFDRDTAPGTFTSSDILSITGPLGAIAGPFTVTADPPGTPTALANRVFRINFPTQTLSGTYNVVISPGVITDTNGNGIDTSLTAGLELLRGAVSPTDVPLVRPVFPANPNLVIPAKGTVTTTLKITSAFQILQATTQLQFSGAVATSINQAGGIGPTDTNMTVVSNAGFPDAPFVVEIGTEQIEVTNDTTLTWTIVRGYNKTAAASHANGAAVVLGQTATIELELDIQDQNISTLTATLTAPNGTVIHLFTKVGNFGPTPHANFTGTVLDDTSPNPIQTTGSPILAGPFDPQTPLSVLDGLSSAGTWTLTITNSGGVAGTLSHWELRFPKSEPISGMGQPVADQMEASFRIFTVASTNAQSSEQWTEIGPIGNYTNTTADAGPVTALAVDPSDPSGNTVFAGGASGGIWETTNFLTTNPMGPTWVPLTDLGPTDSLNIGSIALIPINGNPAQTIIIAGTGNGDISYFDTGEPVYYQGQVGSTGIGFLISKDGGKTWAVLDSSSNYSSSGASLPMNSTQRNHIFDGSIVEKVIADPTPLANGNFVLFAAVSGANGGLYRSVDTGATWQLLKAGNATDVTLAPAALNSNGNETQLYAAFAGMGAVGGIGALGGVFTTVGPADTATALTVLAGNGTSTPRVVAGTDTEIPTVAPLSTPDTVDSDKIVLATPALSNNPLADTFYQGWIYAAVIGNNQTELAAAIPAGATTITVVPNNNFPPVPPGIPFDAQIGTFEVLVTGIVGDTWTITNPINGTISQAEPAGTAVSAMFTGGSLVGLYLSKDFGLNWTLINIPQNAGFGTNNELAANVDTGANANSLSGQENGDYAVSLAIDPNDPNVVYLGGGQSGDGSVIRIDTTFLDDPYALVAYSNNENDGNTVMTKSSGDTQINAPGVYGIIDPDNPNNPPLTNYFDLYRQPTSPFVEPSSLQFVDMNQPPPALPLPGLFNNSGTDISWTSFDDGLEGTTNVHSIIAVTDPLTGGVRLVFGDDQGVYTSVDEGGTNGDYEQSQVDVTTIGSEIVPFGPRNGDLQIAQFGTGATQPSTLAADVAGSFVYGSNPGGAYFASEPDVISNGDNVWNGIGTVAEPLANVGDTEFAGPAAARGKPLATLNGAFSGAVDMFTAGPAPLTPVGATTFTSQMYVDQIIVIDNEEMLILAIQGNSVWVQRGYNETAIANHASGAVIDMLAPGSIENAPGVAADQSGSGQFYQFITPDDVQLINPNLVPTDFFQVTPPGQLITSRVSGLVQATNNPPDLPGENVGQWPANLGFNFTVNPVDPTAIVMGSETGRVFLTAGASTGGTGVTWHVIANPTDLDGTYADALAFGGAPGASATIDNFIYAGTVGGSIFVTYQGGGYNGGTAWRNISTGLDGDPVLQIVPDPKPGTDDAYAVTTTGVFYIQHSGVNGGPVTSWVNITGNLFSLTRPIFNNSSNLYPTLENLTSIAVDWRYAIPTSGGNAPVLYVAGNGGVFDSLNRGGAWSFFPSLTGNNAVQQEGLLPNVDVTSLNLVLGNVNSSTGFANTSAGLNMLVATTYGRGDFAIRLNDSSIASDLVTPNPGPAVTSATTILTNNGRDLSGYTVTFGSAVDPSTFTTAGVTVTGPNGAIAIASVVDISGTSLHNVYQITFTTPQTATGNYKITVGPNVRDFSGNVMSAAYTNTTFFTPDTFPTISTIANQIIQPGTSTSALAFTVGSSSTPLNSLVIGATSSNTGVIPDNDIVLGGSGANRTITITAPAGSYGATTISITVQDIPGLVTTGTFTLNVDTPPTLDPFTSPVTVNYGSTGSTIPFTAVDNNPSGGLTTTAALVDPFLAVQTTLGLNTPYLEQYTNVRGEGEKYLVSTTTNLKNGGFYVLMPNGNLYAWDGNSLPTTIRQTAIATFPQAVYNNPALLTANTGAPIVSVDNPLYDLKMQLGLDTPYLAQFTNVRGGNEKYLLSSNGSNAAFGGFYELLPNNTLVAYSGSPFATGTLVADLSAYGNVYANPSLLTAAEPATAAGVTATITNLVTTGSTTTGDVDITLKPGFGARTVEVKVTTTDGVIPVSQSFEYIVNDTAPTTATVGPQTTSHNVSPTTVNLNAAGNPGTTLTYSATVAGYSPLYDIKAEFGLTQPDITGAFNARHGNEKYFQSTNGSNFANGGFYLLMPTGNLYAWDGVSLATTIAATPVADPGVAAYANTSLLYGAQLPNAPTVFSNQGILYDVQEQYGLTTPDIIGAFNARGAGEKYFQSANGSNAANGGFYVLLPDGLLYAWNGVSLATTVLTTPLANLSSEGVYADTALLYSAVPTTIGDPIYQVKEEFGLYTADIAAAFNARHDNEMYFKSSNGSNAANGGYYVLMPTNKLYAWDGVSLPTTIAQPPVATFTTDVYHDPALLYADDGQTAAVTPSVNSSGLVSLTQSPYYTGTARVTAAASDDAEITSVPFLFTSTNAAPTIATVAPVIAPHDSGPSTVNLSAHDADGDTLSYSVSASADNPLYDLKAQLGLTQPDITGAFNARGGMEKYFQSTNGSNSVNGGFYILMPTGNLYAWDGNSLATTVASANLVGDPGTAAYANTAMLYQAQPPVNPPTVQVNRGPLYDIREEFGLTQPDIAAAFNARGGFEKYFQSTNGSNAFNGGFYVLLPNGDLYAWDGISLATTTAATPVANLSSYGVYAQPSLLYNALPVSIGDPLFAAKDQFGLTNPDITAAFNARGQQEKYFQSTNGSNAANGGFYVLMPTGNLYAWDGISLTTTLATAPVATLGTAAYSNTALLYGSTGLVPAVTATVNASGQITITPNAAFVGTLQITAVATDQLVNTATSFSYTVTEPAPSLVAISAQNASASASQHGSPLEITLGVSSSDASDSFQFLATASGYNPLYALKTQLGLTNPDITSSFNARGGDEKYFQSTNGSNAANGGFYVLMPTGDLYAWDGNSLATTVAPANLVGTPGTAAYANTALLYNAAQPAAPSAVLSVSGNTLTVNVATVTVGTVFTVTVFALDGASEVQQSFLVTVTA